MSKNLKPPADHVRLCLTADSHIRDVHLGVARRGPDFTDGLMQAIDAAERYQCSAILHGGDILNANRPSSQNIRDLLAVDRRLKEGGLPMYVISGNHDKSDPPWINAVLEEPKTPLGQSGLVPADFTSIEISGVTVHALPYLGKAQLIEQLHLLPPADILLWHGSVQELSGFPQPENPQLADLALGKWRAFLMGDIHTRQFIDVEVPGYARGTTLIGYPGATALVQRNDPLTHSVEMIDVPLDRDKPITHFQVPIKTRKALVFNIMSEEVLQEVLKEINKHAKSDPMIFVRYNPMIENCVPRLQAAVDLDRAILRHESISGFGDVAYLGSSTGDGERLRPLEDFAEAAFTDSPELATLARALCSQDAQVNVILAKFIEDRLAMNQAAATQSPAA